jgi:hypothetical protein
MIMCPALKTIYILDGIDSNYFCASRSFTALRNRAYRTNHTIIGTVLLVSNSNNGLKTTVSSNMAFITHGVSNHVSNMKSSTGTFN